MKLFQLVRFASPNSYKYDVAESFVIRAASEREARCLAALGCGDETEEAWLSDKYSMCAEVTSDGPSAVICRDFTAG